MFVYCVTNLLNGKKYIGQTIRPVRARWSAHKRDTRYPIGRAIAKYGKENFRFEILETVDSREELDEREIYWIREFNTIRPTGYNLTEGGKGVVPSEETREKFRKCNAGENNPAYGKPSKTKGKQIHSTEHKQRVSESNTGIKNTFARGNKGWITRNANRLGISREELIRRYQRGEI